VEKLTSLVRNKKVLFITTKNIDYIRNAQELRILRESAAGVDVLCSSQKNNPMRIIDVLIHLSKKRVQQADIVFVGFEPQFVIPFKKRLFKDKVLVIDFFISVYDTLVWDRKKIKDGSVLARLFRRMDEETLKVANHVITDTKAHAEYFISEFHGNPELFETIYLEADPTIYYPREQKKPTELKKKFVVLYFGSVLPLQGVDVVLDAIRVLKDREDIYFDIIGPIPKKYHKPLQDNVSYTEWLPQEELAEHIANADLCLAGHFNAEIEKAKRTIPGKAYIYEMMNRSMILGESIANHELYEEDKRHSFVQMGNVSELIEKILEKMTV
jgi:glycosyltransferase involved in cell wall biosynthesis